MDRATIDAIAEEIVDVQASGVETGIVVGAGNIYRGMSAAAEGRLGGYVGTVAELIHVPTHLEAAVEAALGGRLQEVVVETWADAERAIDMLKTMGAGRATFLPLDTLRASTSQAAPKGSGIVGVARDLVEYAPYLKTLAESLLGRLLIVQDLASARKALGSMQANSPWTLATLGGEVVRPGGSWATSGLRSSPPGATGGQPAGSRRASWSRGVK